MKQIFIQTDLSITQLTRLIGQFYPNWQPCFLNNHNNPVLGILPKLSWTLYPNSSSFDSHQKIRNNFNILLNKNQTTYDNWLKEIIHYQNNIQNHQQNVINKTDNDDTSQNNYCHGLMGFIGYDISANALNFTISTKQSQPSAYLGHYDIYLKKAKMGLVLVDYFGDDDFIEKIYQCILKIIHPKHNSYFNLIKPCQLNPLWQKNEYQKAFYQTQNYLMAGDAYQINLTQLWQGKLQQKLYHYLPNLIQKINAPFAGYLLIDDFELLSMSPELFFTFKKQNNQTIIITKPIKGTRPRDSDIIKDKLLKDELQNSQKDISENLMIVDLLRNDLGKYAKIGSVKTPKRFEIESFYNVHHMVSTITATLKEDVSSFEVLFGSLPAGSITGAPKKRACEIIFELEKSSRGAYCGTLGYMNFDGTGQWNVLIRTLQAHHHTVSLWAGGGITIKSKQDDEYQECFDKINAILEVLQTPNAI